MNTTLDFEAYCRRTGFDGPAAPTLGTLRCLIAQHAAAIPFENIEVLAGRVPGLDLASLQAKLVQSRRGGYCFEQNRLFMACLQGLGFAVRPLEARVRAGVAADVVTARTHMALRVMLEGEDHLVDVGFGGLAPTAPLRLGSRAEQDTGYGVYRFIDAAGAVLLQARTHAGWSDCYRLGPDDPQPIDFEMGNWWVATHPKAMLRQNLLVARKQPDRRLTLFNNQLSTQATLASVPEQRTLGSRAEFEDVLAEAFGLAIDSPDLDAVMAVIARQAAALASARAAPLPSPLRPSPGDAPS